MDAEMPLPETVTDLLSADVLWQRLRHRERCVLPLMLDTKAAEMGDAPLITFDGGPVWSYAETQRLARGTAAALEALGVGRGDRVLVWLGDGPDMIRISLAIWYLGAVMVPLNPELRGEILARLVRYADAELMIAEGALAAQLDGHDLGRVSRIVVLGGGDGAPGGIERLGSGSVAPLERDPSPLARPIEPWDIHTIFLTSGTTGISKGVECSHMHCATMAIDGLRYLRADDRFVTPCGYFHVGGAYAPWAVIDRGASMLVVGKFSSSRFLDQVRRNGATVALLIGVMCDFLLARPAEADDRDTPLRLVVVQPLIAEAAEFMERFGLELYTQYDQTETSPAILSGLIGREAVFPPGYCGQLRPGFEARIVDESDLPVPQGAVGELALRCAVPWVIAERYFALPEQTAKAWRHGWYHTGDMFRLTAKGEYCFVDRSKDVIRRRGENISSFELERELVAHPLVAAAAAYGVASQHGESEVMVALEAVPGARLLPAEIAAHAEARMPAFMVPRYWRVLASLPRSVTDKVVKTDLAADGVTPDTWDRQSADRQSADRQSAPAAGRS